MSVAVQVARGGLSFGTFESIYLIGSLFSCEGALFACRAENPQEQHQIRGRAGTVLVQVADARDFPTHLVAGAVVEGGRRVVVRTARVGAAGDGARAGRPVDHPVPIFGHAGVVVGHAVASADGVEDGLAFDDQAAGQHGFGDAGVGVAGALAGEKGAVDGRRVIGAAGVGHAAGDEGAEPVDARIAEGRAAIAEVDLRQVLAGVALA